MLGDGKYVDYVVVRVNWT